MTNTNTVFLCTIKKCIYIYRLKYYTKYWVCILHTQNLCSIFNIHGLITIYPAKIFIDIQTIYDSMFALINLVKYNRSINTVLLKRHNDQGAALQTALLIVYLTLLVMISLQRI